MKVLVLGADGFFGRNIAAVLAPDHEVVRATRREGGIEADQYYVDLQKRETIAAALKELLPEVIINCAGVVENSEKALVNPIMTNNLLEEVVASGLQPRRIIISGSAGEYGIVDPKNIPVKEDTPLNAFSIYGQSKVDETKTGLKFREEHNLPVTIARIFNPIGVGMGPRFLISNVLKQVDEIRAGEKATLEVSSLASERDVCHIKDAALAVKMLIEGDPQEAIYNIASGTRTSNGTLINLILDYSNLDKRPEIIETATQPEPLVAIQADISRIQNEFGWKLTRTIPETVQEIVDAQNK